MLVDEDPSPQIECRPLLVVDHVRLMYEFDFAGEIRLMTGLIETVILRWRFFPLLLWVQEAEMNLPELKVIVYFPDTEAWLGCQAHKMVI